MHQDDRFHKLGTDSVLLAEFAPIKKNYTVCDLGAGQGALSLLLFMREPRLKIHGIEILPEAARLCVKNMECNNFSDRFTMHVGDMRELKLDNRGQFDIIVSNPPYFKSGSGRECPSRERRLCRAEHNCTAEQLCQTAAQLVKYGGFFSVVYRAERICDMICSMRQNRMEPKILQFVQKDHAAAPSLALITAKCGASPGIKILPPVIKAPRPSDFAK